MKLVKTSVLMILFIASSNFQSGDARPSPVRKKRVSLSQFTEKLRAVQNWLDPRNDSTIFDYIYETNAALGLNLFEGDIMDYNPKHRSAIRGSHYLWRTRIVPYVFDSSVSSEVRQFVQGAINEFHTKTCIRWTPRTQETDYVLFKPRQGCTSTVGHVGGAQVLSLMPPCAKERTAVHEMMHAIGFFHQQNRPDRDNWVQIIYSNIKSGMAKNFDKLAVDTIDTLGTQYDYSSIMHYSRNAFSKNGNPTMLPTRDPSADIGQKVGLSPGDVDKINKLYHCEIQMPSTTTTTSSPTTTTSSKKTTLTPTTQRPVVSTNQRPHNIVTPAKLTPATTPVILPLAGLLGAHGALVASNASACATGFV